MGNQLNERNCRAPAPALPGSRCAASPLPPLTAEDARLRAAPAASAARAARAEPPGVFGAGEALIRSGSRSRRSRSREGTASPEFAGRARTPSPGEEGAVLGPPSPGTPSASRSLAGKRGRAHGGPVVALRRPDPGDLSRVLLPQPGTPEARWVQPGSHSPGGFCRSVTWAGGVEVGGGYCGPQTLARGGGKWVPRGCRESQGHPNP